MKFRFPVVSVLLLLALAGPSHLTAQDDEVSLGDVARNARKNKAQQQQERPVIDNENLAQAMEDVKKLKPADKLVLSVDPSGKSIKVASPDVTCSLSFNARAAALLIKPVFVEDLPIADLLRLDGPASIQDDNLQLDVFNGTDWELREITVGITVERKPGGSAETAARARVIPAAEGLGQPTVEKHSDVTVLYHLKGIARPFSTTTFRENIPGVLAPDQDWHWSIVEAKGIRPPDQPQIPSDLMPVSPNVALPEPEGPAAPAPSSNVPTAPDRSGAQTAMPKN